MNTYYIITQKGWFFNRKHVQPISEKRLFDPRIHEFMNQFDEGIKQNIYKIEDEDIHYYNPVFPIFDPELDLWYYDNGLGPTNR